MTCPECGGQQYIEEVLYIKYRGKNIKEVLDMTFEEARDFFSGNHTIYQKCSLACELGLGYMQLGQSLNTLSGGEAKRIKLAKEMTRYKNKKNLLYIFDEPTVGLHKIDIDRILTVIQRIVKENNTVIVVEHNPDIILNSDYIIDLGPGAGSAGGEVVFAGTPLLMLTEGGTKTAEYLKKYIESK